MNKIASLHEVTLRMEHVKIRYGSRTILKDLDWEIKNGRSGRYSVRMALVNLPC